MLQLYYMIQLPENPLIIRKTENLLCQYILKCKISFWFAVLLCQYILIFRVIIYYERTAGNSDETLNLRYIYDQLKDKYDLELTTGLALDAGFGWDMEVLTGKSILGRFYLYDEGCHYILNYDAEDGIADKHWHPEDTAEALRYVVAFMEGTIVVH